MSKQNNLGQTTISRHFKTAVLSENNWNQVQFKSISALASLRFLASKLLCTEETFTEEDCSALFLSYESCVKLAAAHPEFHQKYGYYLYQLRVCVQNLDGIRKRVTEFRETLGAMVIGEFFTGRNSTFLSKRYFYAVRGQMLKLYAIWIKTRYPKKFPAKKYVGKGYGDHGTAKNVALDGSLSWQETYLCLRTEENSSSVTREDKEVEYFRKLRVHPQLLIF